MIFSLSIILMEGKGGACESRLNTHVFGFRNMIKLPERFANELLRQPETGMDYQIATVPLRDGRAFSSGRLSSGFITRIRGYTKVPFARTHLINARSRISWS
jgi:hypothetical protein